MAPLQFDLSLYETYQTKDANAPLTGTEIEGTVSVKVDWGAGGATQPTAAFDPPAWNATGAGPLTVYDDVIGGVKPIGTVSWNVATHAIVKLEPNTPEMKSRWTVTPVVQLVRTFCPADGSPTQTDITFTDSDTVKGDWFPAASP